MVPKDLPLPLQLERPPVEEHVHPGRAGRLRRIDGPYEEPQRVQDRPREGGEPHPPGGEEDPLAECGQQLGGLGERGDGVPAVALLGHPAGPAEGEEGNMGLRGGLGRVPAHGGGEGVGGIDEETDVVLPYPRGKPVDPAEPTDAHIPGRQPGSGHPPGERGGDADAPVTGEALGQPTRLGGPSQNKHMHRYRHRHRDGLFS